LGKLPHLLSLDASHNNISVMLDFTPPRNLMDVDLSYNQITDMGDLSPHYALRKLILDSILSTVCAWVRELERVDCNIHR
jgi:Leucine-rich repeat (LRR) protein